MLPYPLEDFLQVGLHGLLSRMVDLDYEPTATDRPVIPKLGMRMRLPADMTGIDYYGRGPWEIILIVSVVHSWGAIRCRFRNMRLNTSIRRITAAGQTYAGSVFQTEKRSFASMACSRSASVPGTMAKRIWRECAIPMKSIVDALSI